MLTVVTRRWTVAPGEFTNKVWGTLLGGWTLVGRWTLLGVWTMLGGWTLLGRWTLLGGWTLRDTTQSVSEPPTID